ncbi:hypothetical protein DHEL01_v210619 [Diaporthe helianthi]|uniref:Uncharacterized protein n=1 Tax=Diaporthe helianthi TaxID=158607 RepID=A0A2P5HL88_DIAHE|nr:hypothetical protein DHEL01_v210619 [Diaporthe helianthi]
MDQPHHYGAVGTSEDPTTVPSSRSRLKRWSGATVNRLYIPFSLLSFRSSRTSGSDAKRLSQQQNGGAKSSQPSDSTRSRTSTATEPRSDEQDAVEQLPALPVLGTARRGYLRSLLSLFLDGHDNDGRSICTQTATPVSAHTPMSDMCSSCICPRTLGMYEFDLNSPVVYRFSKHHQLYIGWPDVVNPPPEALVEFETETLPLLEQDLQEICAHLSQQDVRITYELRMSGHADLMTGTVTLAPTVWILYRSGTLAGNVVTAAALNQVVLELDYLQTDIEIHEGGGRIEASSDRKLVDVDLGANDDDDDDDDAISTISSNNNYNTNESTSTNASNKDSIKLSNGAVLTVHVESCRDKDTACGALVCATVQADKVHTHQSLCRLGGLLKINGKYVLGVTTAHGMLDGSGVLKGSFDNQNGVGVGDDDLLLHTPKGKAVDRDAIVLEAGDVEPGAWQPATRDAAIDFLGVSVNSRGDVAIKRAARPHGATDFALLRLRGVSSDMRNRYVPPGSDGPVTIRSTASASSSALDEGPVYILGGAGRVADAQLVWGSVFFIVRGRDFRVRRVQTSQPLGPAASGSWVVKGEVLYGVIITAYKDEPFALMMTAERLFESILGSAFSVRTVELWDGVLPEAEKPWPDMPKGRRTRSSTTTTQASSSSKTTLKRTSSTRTNAATRTQTKSSRPSTRTSSTTQVPDFQLRARRGASGQGGGGDDRGDPAELLGLHPALRGRDAREKKAAKVQVPRGNRAGKLLGGTAQVRSYLDMKLPMLVRRASKGKGKKVHRGTRSEGG